MLFELKDGGVEKVFENKSSREGIENKEESIFINQIDVKLTTMSMHIEATSVHDYPLPPTHVMTLALTQTGIANYTEELFCSWIKSYYETQYDNIKVTIS